MVTLNAIAIVVCCMLSGMAFTCAYFTKDDHKQEAPLWFGALVLIAGLLLLAVFHQKTYEYGGKAALVVHGMAKYTPTGSQGEPEAVFVDTGEKINFTNLFTKNPENK